MLSIHKKIAVLAVTLLALAISGNIALATSHERPTAPLDQTTGAGNTASSENIPLIVPIGNAQTTKSDPTEYFKNVFLYGIGLAALLALAQLVFGAVQYTASAGAPSLQEAAKGRIQNAIIGLILLLGAVTILTMFYRPGQRELIDNLPKNKPGATSSLRTEEDKKNSTDSEWQERRSDTYSKLRETWKTWWRADSQLDPGDARLIQKLIETLHAIEDNPDYDLANNPKGRDGYLAARRELFKTGKILNDGGGTFKVRNTEARVEVPGFYNAYINSRTPPSWAAIQEIDKPQ